MRRSQAGDDVAYRELLVDTRSFLQRFLASRIAAASIDDIVQETLLSIHNKRQTFDPDRSYLAWASTIARYRMIDHVRSGSRQDAVAEQIARQPDLSTSVRPGDDTVTAGLTISGLLRRLPPAQANAIRLVKLEGRSIREAATQLATSDSLIKIRIFRGMKRLNAMIEGDER